MRRVVAALAVLLVLTVTGCGGSDAASDSASRGVVDLAPLDTLRAAFNGDEGRARSLAFGPDAIWDRRLPTPLGSGGPVEVQIESLATLLRPYL